jgi:excisionase family DNA binding protein
MNKSKPKMPRTPSLKLPHLLSVSELAEYLGVSSKTITRRIQRGEIRAHRFGQLLRISDEDALAYIGAHRR